MSYVSTYIVIADSVAQLVDINTTNKIYMNSWQLVWYIVGWVDPNYKWQGYNDVFSSETHCWHPVLNICCNQNAND